MKSLSGLSKPFSCFAASTTPQDAIEKCQYDSLLGKGVIVVPANAGKSIFLREKEVGWGFENRDASFGGGVAVPWDTFA
jgi:hypothetical protein